MLCRSLFFWSLNCLSFCDYSFWIYIVTLWYLQSFFIVMKKIQLLRVENIYQLWTFYEVNMLYMDLLWLYWPRTKSEVNIILTGQYIAYWQSKKSLIFILHIILFNIIIQILKFWNFMKTEIYEIFWKFWNLMNVLKSCENFEFVLKFLKFRIFLKFWT